MRRQYITNPPNLPAFLYKHRPEYTLPKLIAWAKQEFDDRLRYCAENGYWYELKRLNDEYSPMRVLAEMSGFRRICANVVNNQAGWNKLSGRDRVFIRRSYELRDLLMRNLT